MIHHVSLGTNNRSRAFYDAVLDVLGLRLLKASLTDLDVVRGGADAGDRPGLDHRQMLRRLRNGGR